MNLKTFELAKRAVTCKNWKWMPGMRYTTDRWLEGFDRVIDQPDRAAFADWLRKGRIPELSDPATIGCLLDLVRKAWPIAPANVNHHGAYSPEKGHYHFWSCSYCTGEKWEQAHGETEAEALVIALEASNV